MQNAKIEIGDRIIGENEPVFVIAEAGINHDGNVTRAEQLIIEAKKAGADAVKFQSFKAARLVSRNEPLFKLFKDLELSKEDHQHLFKVAKNEGIIFLSTPFDQESAQMLEELEVVAFKIASGDLTHFPLLECVARYKKLIILSTGMSTLSEVEEAIGVIKEAGNERIILLHCNSTYPAEIEELNLRTIFTLREAFDLPAGFSDHTVGYVAPLIAAALGAVVIEKHFTLDKSLSGPDHKLSLDPKEMKEMVESLKRALASLGDGIKRVTPKEQEVQKLARRSIVAKQDLARGTVITPEMLEYLRPADGLSTGMARLLIGRVLKRNLSKAEMIKLEDI